MNHHIFGIQVNHRTERIPAVQDVLTKFGCNIRMRLGIHEADRVSCSLGGIILIDCVWDPRASRRVLPRARGLAGSRSATHGLPGRVGVWSAQAYAPTSRIDAAK